MPGSPGGSKNDQCSGVAGVRVDWIRQGAAAGTFAGRHDAARLDPLRRVTNWPELKTKEVAGTVVAKVRRQRTVLDGTANDILDAFAVRALFLEVGHRAG